MSQSLVWNSISNQRIYLVTLVTDEECCVIRSFRSEHDYKSVFKSDWSDQKKRVGFLSGITEGEE